jgi:LacI family transcriptional regulator
VAKSEIMAKLTSKEIARLAGVSASTVSIVLNEKPGVSEDTRNRILDILSQNGHMLVSKSAGDLKGGLLQFCKLVKHGQVVNERHNTFISDYTDGIIEEAKIHQLSVGISVYNQAPMHHIAETLRGKLGLSGCIVLATELSEEDIRDFSRLDVPLVFLDAMFDFVPCDFVTMDNTNMTFSMIHHLWELGHKNIGLLYGEGCSNFDQRKLGFIHSLEALNLRVNEKWMVKVGSTNEAVQENMLHWLATKPKMPTAFFACNDMIAIGAIAALQSKTFRIPQDISIGGFDDIPVTSFINPKLTTISVPKFEIGRMSVKVLIDKIRKGSGYVSQKCMLSGAIIKRQSTGPISG